MKHFRAPHFVRLVSSVLAAVIALLASAAMAEEIKIGGTGNGLGTMRLLGAAFTKKYPEAKVSVLGSLGSSGAVKAVPKGVIDIGISSRVLTDGERKDGLVATEYARTLTVFAVSTKSSVTGVTLEQIADIYSAKLVKWPDGTTIRPVLRQPGDDNTKQVRGLSQAIDQALNAAEKRSGLPFAVIDQEAAEKIETTPGAFGVTTLALIKSESRALRALKLNNVEPTPQNGTSGDYPIIKRFYFITKQTPPDTVQKFIAFANSPDGREVLTQTGHWIP